MPFKHKTVMEEKLEFVRLAESGTVKFSVLCRRFNISRPTGYKWLGRYKMYGISGLQELSRRPKTHRCPTPDLVVQLVLSLKRKEPRWGSKKLRVLLLREGSIKEKDVPSERTINRILRKHGMSAKGPKVPIKVDHFEYEQPNQLWQMDFKGHFAMLNGKRCYPLTITDDHSRFNISLKACEDQTLKTVQQELMRVFKRFGMPLAILCDNAPPWGSTQLNNFPGRRVITQLQAWLIRLGVKMIHGRPRHPQTQGKCERFHRTLKHELIDFSHFKDLQECQQRFQEWRFKYNHHRPHEAINMQVPADRYRSSKQHYPQTLPEPNYSKSDWLVQVSQKGSIRVEGQEIYVGEGLQKQTIALRKAEKNNTYEAFYCNHKITEVTLKL